MWFKDLFKENKNEKEYIEMKKEYSDKDRIDFEKNKIEKVNDEIWKDVKDYERWYEVSNLGNVRKINKDGTTKVLCIGDTKGDKGRTVGLRKTGKPKTYQVSHLVAEAFNVKTTSKNKNRVYHIDGNINNDCLTNLTYDMKETEEYIKTHKEENKPKETTIDDYIEEHKVFLKQAKEMNKEITIKDLYNKLCEILEVLKNGNR